MSNERDGDERLKRSEMHEDGEQTTPRKESRGSAGAAQRSPNEE